MTFGFQMSPQSHKGSLVIPAWVTKVPGGLCHPAQQTVHDGLRGPKTPVFYPLLTVSGSLLFDPRPGGLWGWRWGSSHTSTRCEGPWSAWSKRHASIIGSLWGVGCGGSCRPLGGQEFSTLLSPTLPSLLQAESPYVQPNGVVEARSPGW